MAPTERNHKSRHDWYISFSEIKFNPPNKFWKTSAKNHLRQTRCLRTVGVFGPNPAKNRPPWINHGDFSCKTRCWQRSHSIEKPTRGFSAWQCFSETVDNIKRQQYLDWWSFLNLSNKNFSGYIFKKKTFAICRIHKGIHMYTYCC